MGRELPVETHGSALFADLSGFTSLTETLRLRHGRRKGGEVLRKLLDAVSMELGRAIGLGLLQSGGEPGDDGPPIPPA